MSPVSATAVALLLCAAAMFPFAWMALRPAASRWLAPFCAAAVVALAFFQTGIFNPSALPQVQLLMQADTPEARCQQVLKVLMDNGIVLQPPGPEGLVVRGEIWDRFPQNVREAVLGCAQSLASPGDNRQIKLVRR